MKVLLRAWCKWNLICNGKDCNMMCKVHVPVPSLYLILILSIVNFSINHFKLFLNWPIKCYNWVGIIIAKSFQSQKFFLIVTCWCIQFLLHFQALQFIVNHCHLFYVESILLCEPTFCRSVTYCPHKKILKWVGQKKENKSLSKCV